MVALFMVLLYLFVYPHYAVYFPKCMFYMITGLHCPGCGSQRAFTALLHGDIRTAFHDNLLAIILVPFILYKLFLFLFNLFGKEKIHSKIFNTSLFAKAILISLIVFAVLRNIPVFPFTLLAPVS
jgi:hypothetical protein